MVSGFRFQSTEDRRQIKLVPICSSAKHGYSILDNPYHLIGGLPFIEYRVSSIEYRVSDDQQTETRILTPDT